MENLVGAVEESPLLEAVARQQLIKTLGWISFNGCCGDLRVVEISDGAVIARGQEWCV
jgi:hypothetical protein